MKKCPNCGAPVSGHTCAYCGQEFTPSPDPAAEAAETVRKGRKQIILGIILLIPTAAAMIDLQYWHDIYEILADLLLSLPGIILLWMGIRKVKPRKQKEN